MADMDIAVAKQEGGIPVVESTNFKPLGDTPVAEGFVVVPHYVEVIAPSDMPSGYQFSVDHNGRHLVVAVPEGGVKQGSQFKAQVVRDSTETNQSHNIPVGQWRDGTMDCCQMGCCHPQCCLTFWFTPVALGQLLTRMKLDWCGTPISPDAKQTAWSAFRVLFCMFVVYQAVDTLFYYLTNEYIQASYNEQTGTWTYPENIPMWVNILDAIRHAMSIAYGLLILFITIRTRSHIRAKYAIPNKPVRAAKIFAVVFGVVVAAFAKWLVIPPITKHMLPRAALKLDWTPGPLKLSSSAILIGAFPFADSILLAFLW
eukprot:CAMPEP_0172451284 /NCGR_PEP_ID=MMETSP1065-20121228/9388_1 /TAXON_ID=265537 /ORGANISM="Amphiprora paludosa, Strain CCMP125" /LENGTH=313 /DNA_ID=CAMNT_0013203223 /DNA_START=25 /DNA_END=964 /DNA_ORIENTATION=+